MDLKTIRPVDITQADLSAFSAHLADCVILTHDNRLLMQQRPLDWGSSPGCLTTFGGHVDPGETPLDGLVRELKEELGADVEAKEAVFIGAVSEDWTNHSELVHVYFWHDKKKLLQDVMKPSRVFMTVLMMLWRIRKLWITQNGRCISAVRAGFLTVSWISPIQSPVPENRKRKCNFIIE